MSLRCILPSEVRGAWLARREIALLDLRPEAAFALGHPLFASQIPIDRLRIEAPSKLPRRSCRIVIYDDGEGLIADAAAILEKLGYEDVRALENGLAGWRDAGFELFQDVNSYSKAFGELVEHRRQTPSLLPREVKAILDGGESVVILDARRFDEYSTMAIPGGVSVPGAELVLRVRELAPNPATRIIVNCAGRTRSLIGAQSLINAGLPNQVHALRNGTIGWSLAGLELARGMRNRFGAVSDATQARARADAREVAYRAGVREIDGATLDAMAAERGRSLYRFDVRTADEYAAGHLEGFAHAEGGQLVQEIDMFAPVRGARIVLADDLGVRADMTASWLAQMGWDVYVMEAPDRGAFAFRDDPAPPPRGPEGRYKRPYEGTDNPIAAMEAYLEWEYGLVAQLANDGSHGFYVI